MTDQSLIVEPLVSIIINCYNGEQFLRGSIDSVYAQTYSNWEIIFWDNASTDGSAEIAQSYDHKLRYFKASVTTLLGKARVLAVNEARGKYLAFLDYDDLWLSDKLEKQVKLFLQTDDTGLIYSSCEVISENGETSGQIPSISMTLPSGNVFAELVKINFVPFVSALVCREKYYQVGGFPVHYKNSTDYSLFLKLSHRYQVLAINQVLCKYRDHPKSLSKRQYVIGAEESIQAVSSFLPDQRAVEGLQYQYVNLVIAYIKQKRLLTAMILLIKHGGLKLLFKRIIAKIA